MKPDASGPNLDEQPTLGAEVSPLAVPAAEAVTLAGTAMPAGAPAQTKVGNYTIVKRLGEGGMGVVYEALQENPRRAVALKIVRGAFADEHAVRMFQREAQVLGRLKHPGIAAIYESGQAGDGQYYFAMELVRGVRLDEYLQRQKEDAASSRGLERRQLEVFLQLCEAVSYAHQRGVIHRDLKPANILVQEPETLSPLGGHAPAQIKVLDFGLARISEDELGGLSVQTQPGTIQGTVPYMSPEQVCGQVEQVDVRSDEYALGVILYQLRSGQMPYELRRASLPEAARIICETPPQALPPALRKTPLGRDLAVIVNKALAKEPAGRYQSVAALAEDIHRALNDQPILAQAPSTVYQVRKLVARHKASFAFILALVVLLVALAGAMTVAARRIAGQRDRANREAQVAEQVSGFLVRLFQVSKPERARGKTITARELLDKGAASIQAERSMDPQVKASLLDTIGDAYSSLGFYRTAQPLLEAALKTRQEVFGAESAPVAQTLKDLGGMAADQGETQAAERYYLQSLAAYRKAEGGNNDDFAKALNNAGTAEASLGHLRGAQSYFQRALDLRTALSGPSSAQLIPIRANLAYLAYERNDYAGAVEQFRQELALAKKVDGPDHPFVAELENNIGAVLFMQKQYGAAGRYYRQALALDRKLLGGAHPQIGQELANLGEVEDASGSLRGAQQDYQQALAILRAKVPGTDARLRFVETNLGSVLVREGGAAELQEGSGLLRTALAADKKALPAAAWDIADAESELGGCLLAQGRVQAAEPLLVNSLRVLRAQLGANDPASVPRALQRLVAVEMRLGKRALAQHYAALLHAAGGN
ncbi:MAG: protein kinase domain-containing protein [Terriglobales bacterium]